MKTIMVGGSNLGQFIRFGIVGLFNNLMGYLVYLVITSLGLEPKIAITLFYSIGMIIAYYTHLKYSFAYEKMSLSTGLRFILAYLIGYFVNFMMLTILVDKYMLPHQGVQALAILVVAGIIFLMLKYFVFPISSLDAIKE